MFLSAHNRRDHEMMRKAVKAYVIDRNTGERISHVIWANDKTGRYRRYLTDEAGELIVEGDGRKSKIFKGDIKIIVEE